MTKLNEILLAVHQGELQIEDLDEAQQTMVIDGYLELAEQLMANPEFADLAGKIKEILSMVENDPFEEFIQQAESRGSTYWEIENDHLH